MDRMMVAVFDSESEAYEGQSALLELDDEGSITVYAYAVLAKNADGTTTLEQDSDDGPLGTLAGTSFGALIGALGGPAGMAVGAAVGAVSGSAVDIDNARVGSDFIDDVSEDLRPNRVALVAEIEEEWTEPVDSRMEAIGGTVYRRALSDVTDAADSKDIAAMQADHDQMKAEHAKAQSDRRTKLTEKINQLDSKIQTRLQEKKDQRAAVQREVQAKAAFLKSKAAESRARAS